jgi:hypothetical protein
MFGSAADSFTGWLMMWSVRLRLTPLLMPRGLQCVCVEGISLGIEMERGVEGILLLLLEPHACDALSGWVLSEQHACDALSSWC